jgi:hypothetical protein
MTIIVDEFIKPQGGMVGLVSISDVNGLTANARIFANRRDTPEISVRLNVRCSISDLWDIIDELVEFRNVVRQLSMPASKEDLTL